MKITEVTEIYLAEGLVSPAELEPYLPKDGDTEYYERVTLLGNKENVRYVYDKENAWWYDDSSSKKASLVVQRNLMNRYGFSATGKPSRKLLKKIQRDKDKHTVKTKNFDAASVAKIETALQNSYNDYTVSGNLIRYFKNLDVLIVGSADGKTKSYFDQGFKLTKLKPKVENYFQSVGLNPADQQTLDELLAHVFVNPDPAAYNVTKNNYSTRISSTPPTSFKSLSTADDAKVKTSITTSIRTLNAANAGKIPTHLTRLKTAGYQTANYETLVRNEINRLVNSASGYNDIDDLSAFFDVIIGLKSILPKVSATYGSKIIPMNFSTMVSGITVRDLAALEAKRAEALR